TRELSGDACPRRLTDAGPCTPPAREVTPGGGAVGAQVAPGDLDDRLVGVDVAPSTEPLTRADERDAGAAARSEAQQAAARRRLEHAAPARPEDLVDVRRFALADDG